MIIYEDSETKGRYVARVDGKDGEAELTLSKLSSTMIIADHTAVPDSLRGLGLAKALTERLIEDARKAGQKVVPLCPFVKSYAQRHADAVRDVIQL